MDNSVKNAIMAGTIIHYSNQLFLSENSQFDGLIDKGMDIVDNNPELLKGMGIGATSILALKMIRDLIRNRNNRYLFKKKKFQILNSPEKREALQDFVSIGDIYYKKNN